MSDPTNAERQRRWYARQKAGTPWQPLTCQACGGNSSGTHDPLCSHCWQGSTVEGRTDRAARVAKARAKRDGLFTAQPVTV